MVRRRPEVEEEEEGSSEENGEPVESESESDSGEDKASTPLPRKPPTAKKSETQSSSSDDSGSESDSPPGKTRPVDSNLKPIPVKPMEEAPKAAKKPRSKPSSATPVGKPLVEVENKGTRDTKKVKRKAVDADGVAEEGTPKKQLFQRLWSENDEIEILKGMIEFTIKKGIKPSADLSGFYDFIKKSLHVDVSKEQLSAKMRRLKKKYLNNESKSKKDKDRIFSNPHEQKTYELSKKVWGDEANDLEIHIPKPDEKSTKKRSKTSSLAAPEVKGGSKMEIESKVLVSPSVLRNSSIGKSSLDNEIVQDGLELISGTKKVELQEKWKKLRMEELELYLKRVDLIREQTKLVLEALKSAGH